MGDRITDRVVNQVGHESKVGRTSNGSFTRTQVAKDKELLQNTLKKQVWHFYRSPVTGKVGPSKPLEKNLLQSGIQIVIHP